MRKQFITHLYTWLIASAVFLSNPFADDYKVSSDSKTHRNPAIQRNPGYN